MAFFKIYFNLTPLLIEGSELTEMNCTHVGQFVCMLTSLCWLCVRAQFTAP